MKTILLLILAFLLGCSQDKTQSMADSTGKLKIVTTTGMIADAAKNIGGDRVSVTALMGPGIDPHLYKASEGDVRRMSGADLILYNGLHLEGKMAEIFEQMSKRHHTAAVAEDIPAGKLLQPAEFQGNYDPHVWFDVSLWMQVAATIANTLSEVDPQGTEQYQANLKSYQQELDQLHEYVATQAGRVEADKRVLVTAHDAFNYFGRAYGFEVRGLQGISTAAETGAGDVAGLAQFIVDRKIPAIFVETSVPPRYIEALQAAVRSRGFDVKIGGNLFSDAMGDDGTPQGNYPGMVRHNIDTIVNALIEAPAL